MKKCFIAIFLMFFGIFVPTIPAGADNSSPRIIISQFKVTSSNGQFFTLYNNTGSSIDMSKVQLQYFNNYDLSVVTSTKNISLSGSLPAHGYYGVNDGIFQMCYQSVVDSVSLGFSSTSGMVQISEIVQASKGQGVTQNSDDYVAWAANGTKNLPTSVWQLPPTTSAATSSMLRRPSYSNNNPAITIPGGGEWKQAQINGDCSLTITTDNTLVNPLAGQLLPGSLPPATFVSAPDDTTSSNTGILPASDIGLAAPRITELLPNPAQPQMDAEDEFIELYNPNNATFDLSGFTIEIGLTTKHDYTFPAGTILSAKLFKAFFSGDTSLSLSNSGGQVWLLDPMNNIISQTQAYGTAKDGQTWALGPDGKWYWSMTATPNAANIVLIPSTSTSKKSSSSSSSKTPKTSVKGTSTSSKNGSTNATGTDPQATGGSKMHLWILAVIGAGAVLYAVYEYRNDLANLLYRVRRYRASRRTPGQNS